MHSHALRSPGEDASLPSKPHRLQGTDMRAVSSMIRRRQAFIALLLGMSWFTMASIASADTFFSMNGDAGDWISQGREHFYTPASGTFSATPGRSNGASIRYEGGSHWWYLEFKRPYDRALSPGRYVGAVRAAFAAMPSAGLDVSGDGRGCSKVQGAFEVRQAVYGPGNTLLSFWATFEQHCEGLVPAARGEIRFNADTLLYVLPPSDLWAHPGQAVRFDVAATDTRGLVPTLTAAGLPAGATFQDHGNGSATFDWPAGSPDTTALEIRIDARSVDGAEASGSCVLHVVGDDRLVMSSEPGDYIGGGRDYFYDLTNAAIRILPNYQSGVSLSVTSGDHWWNLNFSAPGGAPLQVGNYPNATRFPFNGNGAGLSIGGDGRGCNGLTGQFTVLDIGYGPGGVPERFWATFEQHCEGFAPALRGEIKIGGDLPVTTSLAVVSAEAQPGRNHLEWFAAEAAGLEARVQRREENSGWSERAVMVADGTGRFVFDDTDVIPGRRYGYRLAYSEGAGTLQTGETWLAAANALALRLDRPWPNPSRGTVLLGFALPEGGHAILEMVDLSGRRMARRDLGSLEAGEHRLVFEEAGALPAGTYWLRLVKDGQVRTRSVLLIR